MQVLVLRHGESTWNTERRWQGWLDAPLTPKGEAQAAARARTLAQSGFRPRVVYTSDLGRAARTAEIIAAHVNAPVIPEAGFRERNGGEWQGLTAPEIDDRWPGMRQQWRHGEISAPPGGERDDVVLSRFDRALTRAIAHAGTGMLCIVTHHGMLRVVATRSGVDVHTLIPNLGGYWFDVVDGELRNAEPVDTLPDDEEHAPVE